MSNENQEREIALQKKQEAIEKEWNAIKKTRWFNRGLTPEEKIAMDNGPLDSGFLVSDFGLDANFNAGFSKSSWWGGRQEIENDTSSAKDGAVEAYVGPTPEVWNSTDAVKSPILQVTRKVIQLGNGTKLELNNKGFLCVGSNSDRFLGTKNKEKAEKLNEVLARTYLRKVRDSENPAVTVKFGHKIKESFQIKHLYGLVEAYSTEFEKKNGEGNKPTYADIEKFFQALSKGGTNPNYIEKLKTMVIDKKLKEISHVEDPIDRFVQLTQYKVELSEDEKAMKIYADLITPGYLYSSAYVEKLALTPNNLPGLVAEYAQYKEDEYSRYKKDLKALPEQDWEEYSKNNQPKDNWDTFRDELVNAGANLMDVKKVKVEMKLLELSQVENLTQRFQELATYKKELENDPGEQKIYDDLMKPGLLYSSDYYNKLALTPQNLSGLAEEYVSTFKDKPSPSPTAQELDIFYQKLTNYGAKEEDLKKVKVEMVEMKLREISAGPNDKGNELQTYKNTLESDKTSLDHYDKLVHGGQWNIFAPVWLKDLRRAQAENLRAVCNSATSLAAPRPKDDLSLKSRESEPNNAPSRDSENSPALGPGHGP